MASVAPDLIASQARFDAALAAAAGEAQAEREKRRLALQAIDKLAVQYAAHLEAGDFSAARKSNQELVPLLSSVDALPPALEARTTALHARYAELLQTQQQPPLFLYLVWADYGRLASEIASACAARRD